jgi:hypothetical protein
VRLEESDQPKSGSGGSKSASKERARKTSGGAGAGDSRAVGAGALAAVGAGVDGEEGGADRRAEAELGTPLGELSMGFGQHNKS